MYSKEFFVKQFSALNTDSLVEKLDNQALTEETFTCERTDTLLAHAVMCGCNLIHPALPEYQDGW